MKNKIKNFSGHLVAGPVRPILVMGVLSLTGCQVLQMPETGADIQLPAQFTDMPSQPVQRLSWSTYFTDPVLQQLLQQTLQHNQDLQLAALRVAEAQAMYGIQRAELYPQLGLGTDFSRNRVPADLSPLGQSYIANQFQVGVGLQSWELDLWGRIRSLKQAALKQFLAQQANQIAVQNSLIAQVASVYLNLSALDQRVELAEHAVGSYQNSVRIFKRRYDVGSGSKVEYTQAQTLLSNAQNLLAQIQQARASQQNLLIQLVGRPVQLTRPTPLSQIQWAHQAQAVGLPSDLLLNRPDLRAAEYQLQAQSANIQAARLAFFPRISLTGGFATASDELEGLFQPQSQLWQFAPSISIPIFTAGRLKANLNLAQVRQQMAVQEYEKTIQNAFREVRDALQNEDWLTRQLQIQRQGLKAFHERVRLAQLSYDNGAVTYLEVLDAQRSLLAAEQQAVEVQSALLKNQVALYLALGGDISLTHRV